MSESFVALERAALAALDGYNHFGGIRRGGPLGFQTWCDTCPTDRFRAMNLKGSASIRIAVSETLSEAEWWWRRHVTEMEARR